MKIPITILASLSLLGGVAAQAVPCHAEFDGNIFKDTVSMGGPNFTNCIRTTTSKALLILAVQVFTGERTGTSTVGIWSHDPATGLPLQELATGTFAMQSTNSWQGANLSKPVILSANTTFFVSWIPVSGSQASVQNSGSSLPGLQTYYWSRTNSAPWNGPYKGHQWKFRCWCTPLNTNPPGIVTIGSGCSDGFGVIGSYFTTETPSVGNANFKLEGKNLPPASPALFVLGLQKNFPSLDLTFMGGAGCFLHSDLAAQFMLLTGPGTPSKSDGTFLQSAPIPQDPTLKGLFVRSQLAVADSNSRRSLKAVFTNGLGITIQ